jgi:hypothetical protein
MVKTPKIIGYCGYTSSDLNRSTYPGSESEDSDESEEEVLQLDDNDRELVLDSGDQSKEDDPDDEDSDANDQEAPAKVVKTRPKAVVSSKKAQKNLPTQRKSKTSKGKTTTPAPAARKKKTKSTHVTPESPVQTDEISPVSTGFADNRKKRRQDSVSTMGSSARDDRNNSKKRQADLETDNNEKDRELKRLKKKTQELEQKLADAEQPPQDFATPMPRARASGKNRQSKKESLGKTGSKKGVTIDSFVKSLAKAQFRHTKFVANEAQFRQRVGDHVMDGLEMEKLHHKDGESELEAARVESYRDKFFHEWMNVMASGYNEARNYRQGRVKDACIKWLAENGKTELFPTEDLEIVMKRDFSAWEPKMDEHGEQVTDGNPEKLAYYHKLSDFYVDELVPAVCSHHDFKPSVRHFTPLCDARFADSDDGSLDGQVIVTPGTEALILFFVKNARTKWESMFDWEYTQGKKDKKKYPFPKWSPKEPEKNIRWKTLYSDAASGQNPFGGWKIKGLKEYSNILTTMKTVRKDVDLCRYQDKLTQQRLYEANKEDYEKEDTKHAAAKDDDDLDTLDMVFEDTTEF